MTTIIIDEKTKRGKIILDLIRELKAGDIVQRRSKKEVGFNDTTLNAIREASEGKCIVCENYDDYHAKVGK